MKVRFLGIVAIAALSFCAGPLVAHHSTDPVFDLANPIILKGVIANVSWLNPHTYMFMDVTTCKVDNWAVELGSRPAMDRAGLTRNTFKPGMAISVLSAPAKRSSTGPLPEVAERAKSGVIQLKNTPS